MKLLTIIALLFLTSLFLDKEGQLPSKVYKWKDSKVQKEETREVRPILEGSTTDFENLEIHATTLKPNEAPHPAHTHENEEELIIVKEGSLKINIEGKIATLGPGSIALIVPGDEHGLENAKDTTTSYYIMKYRSKAAMDTKRGKEAGGSFTMNWNDIQFNEHDKGGVRHFFEKPTAMCKEFEMHVTTLNEGLQSHPPHTHRPAEIILMVNGDTEMQIGEKFHKGTQGDLFFMGSDVPHSIRNTGKGSTTYFAFQFE